MPLILLFLSLSQSFTTRGGTTNPNLPPDTTCQRSFDGLISLELDMAPTSEVAFPLIRHLRFHALPRVQLDRDFVEVMEFSLSLCFVDKIFFKLAVVCS